MGEASLLVDLLQAINELIVAAVLIVAFSLLAYIVLQNWRTPITQALCVLLTGVVVVFGGDLLLAVPPSREDVVQFLLRAQWLGIVFVPAGYVHLADALLAYADRPSGRRWLTPLSYLSSLAFLALALSTDLLVSPGIDAGPFAQFEAGPLFWFFTLYFALASLGGLYAVMVVRRNALTPTLRRRLTYLGATFLTPGLAVFPYLVIAGALELLSLPIILLASAVVNAGVAVMVTIMVYSVAFQGLLLPDRLIKHEFIRWGLYGPFIGIATALFLRSVPPLSRTLGLPVEIVATFGVMIMTVLMPLFVSRIKPYIDAMVYMQDHAEIDYLRDLPRSTFTSADLRSLLENTLVVVCGSLRVNTGFVAAPDEDHGYTIKTLVGSRRNVKQFVAEHPLSEIIPRMATSSPREANAVPPTDAFVRCNGFCLLPLHGPEGNFLGALGVANPHGGLTIDARRLIGAMAHQMEMALATVQMQQRLFGTLRGMGPEMQSLQQLNSRLEQATPATLETMDSEVALLPEFPQLVKDALTHYWGGPKLSDSPLLGLRTVRRLLQQEQSGSPTRALQAVLRRAIENLRPDDQLDPTAQEWILYNILEMRFLQGKRARETADRLAMSESDMYRKQRIAIEEVARQLALMEEAEAR